MILTFTSTRVYADPTRSMIFFITGTQTAGLLNKENMEELLCDDQGRARYWQQFVHEHKLQPYGLSNNNNTSNMLNNNKGCNNGDSIDNDVVKTSQEA